MNIIATKSTSKENTDTLPMITSSSPSYMIALYLLLCITNNLNKSFYMNSTMKEPVSFLPLFIQGYSQPENIQFNTLMLPLLIILLRKNIEKENNEELKFLNDNLPRHFFKELLTNYLNRDITTLPEVHSTLSSLINMHLTLQHLDLYMKTNSIAASKSLSDTQISPSLSADTVDVEMMKESDVSTSPAIMPTEAISPIPSIPSVESNYESISFNTIISNSIALIPSDLYSNITISAILKYTYDMENTKYVPPPITIGSTVIRGPDWSHGNEDGHRNTEHKPVGTVTRIINTSTNTVYTKESVNAAQIANQGKYTIPDLNQCIVTVRWPNEIEAEYKYGLHDAYELLLVKVNNLNTILKTYPKPENLYVSHQQQVLFYFPSLSVMRTQDKFECKALFMKQASTINTRARVDSRVNDSEFSFTIYLDSIDNGYSQYGWNSICNANYFVPHLQLKCVFTKENSVYKCAFKSKYTIRLNPEYYAYNGNKTTCLCKVHGSGSSESFFLNSSSTTKDTALLSIINNSSIRNNMNKEITVTNQFGIMNGYLYYEIKVDHQEDHGSIGMGIIKEERICEKGNVVYPSSRVFFFTNRAYRGTLEIPYGDFINENETVGMRINIPTNSYAFNIDAMRYGDIFVKDLGVINYKPYDSPSLIKNPMIYKPYFFLRDKDDQFTFTNQFILIQGLNTSSLISEITSSYLLFMNCIENRFYSIPESFIQHSYIDYCRICNNYIKRYQSRGDEVFVDINTAPNSISSLIPHLVPGDIVRIKNTSAEILLIGTNNNRIWYRYNNINPSEGVSGGCFYVWQLSPYIYNDLEFIKHTTLLDQPNYVPKTPLSYSDYASILHTYCTYQQLMDLAHWMNKLCNSQHVSPYNINHHTLLFNDIYINLYNDQYIKEDVLLCLLGFLLFMNWRFLRVAPFYYSSSQYCITGDNIYFDKHKINTKVETISPSVTTPTNANENSNTTLYSTKSSIRNQESLDYYYHESSLSFFLANLKYLLFDDVRNLLFSSYMFYTTSITNYSMDDYELPSSIPTFTINRIISNYQHQKEISDIFARIHNSLLYQIHTCIKKSSSFNPKQSFIMNGHGGQARAFSIRLVGEGVSDNGGPYRELFENIIEEIEYDDILPILTKTPNCVNNAGFTGRDCYVFNPLLPSDPCYALQINLIRTLGELVGIAVHHSIQIPLHFSSLIYKLITQTDIDIYDLEEVDTLFVEDIHNIEECSIDDFNEMYKDLKWSVQLSNNIVIPVSNHNPCEHVTFENRIDYIHCAVKSRLMEYKYQILSFIEGLNLSIPCTLFNIYTWNNLEEMITGISDIDINLLQSLTIYKDGLTGNEQYIKWLWEVVKNYSFGEKKKFLLFVSSRSSLPVRDIENSFKLVIRPMSVTSTKANSLCPTSQTCFITLSIPPYTSKEILKHKLDIAINHSPTMDADIRLHDAQGWDTL